MYKVYINNTDITEFIERNTVSITEALNNRRNTANFSILGYEVSEGQEVEIFVGSFITKIDPNPRKLFLDNIFKFESRYFEGQEVILDIKGLGEIRTIESIDLDEKSIVFTEDITGSYSKGTAIGTKAFAGIIVSLPDENFTKTDDLIYRVNASDYSTSFNNEVVVETFENQYAKEILGRSIYEFVARDEELNGFLFESLDEITTSGSATAKELSSENINGNTSLKVGGTAASNAIYSIDLPSALDCSNLTDLRYWINLKPNVEGLINNVTVKFGSSASDYFSFSKNFDLAGYWSYEAVSFAKCNIVGNPSLASINYIEFDFDFSDDISKGDILLDDLVFTRGGFTLNNTERGSIIFEDVRIQYKKPTEVVEKIAKETNSFWYIDYEKDLHFFANSSQPAPIEITPESNNYGGLERNVDITQLKNRQTIRGGIAVADSRYIQEEVTDGKKTSWSLNYPPKDLRVFVDITGTGNNYIEKTVGTENLTDELSVDYLFNFAEKVVRQGLDPLIAEGGLIKLDYLPYKDIRVRYQDKTSIDKMKAITGGNGVYDGAVINDESIRTFEDARIRARAEIEAYKNPIVTLDFFTNKENLKAGQLIRVVDPARDIDDSFLIQKLKKVSKGTDYFVTTVTAASTLFGYIEFFQLLFKKTSRGEVDVNEIVDIVVNLDETLKIKDQYIFTKKTAPFFAMGPTPNETPNDAYADFSETA